MTGPGEENSGSILDTIFKLVHERRDVLARGNGCQKLDDCMTARLDPLILAPAQADIGGNGNDGQAGGFLQMPDALLVGDPLADFRNMSFRVNQDRAARFDGTVCPGLEVAGTFAAGAINHDHAELAEDKTDKWDFGQLGHGNRGDVGHFSVKQYRIDERMMLGGNDGRLIRGHKFTSSDFNGNTGYMLHAEADTVGPQRDPDSERLVGWQQGQWSSEDGEEGGQDDEVSVE